MGVCQSTFAAGISLAVGFLLADSPLLLSIGTSVLAMMALSFFYFQRPAER